MPPQVVTVKNAGKVAAALQNEKCQRILEHLQKRKDATETELAQELALPLSTVHYNMKVLAEANLVLDDVYSYSSRGKHVTHYRINKNPIVIVQEESELDFLKAIVPAAVLAACIGLIYQIATQTTTAVQTAAPMLAKSAAPLAADAGIAATETAQFAAAPLAQEAVTQTTNTPFLQPFIFGVLAVVLISFAAVLALRWWNRRER